MSHTGHNDEACSGAVYVGAVSEMQHTQTCVHKSYICDVFLLCEYDSEILSVLF